MTSLEQLKQDVCEVIDCRRGEIIDIGETIRLNPETGFKETKTSALISQKFRDLHLPCREKLALTGCRADLDSGVSGPSLALLGELDALILPTHPDAVNGAVHACGHHAQIANLAGAAIGLTAAGAEKHISGKISFIAVPAEEFIEMDQRLELMRQKKIRYCGGKAEMIRLGVFDDIDAAMLIHAGEKYLYQQSYNCFVMKNIVFFGKSAHAALWPEQGINALYAAKLCLDAINAQRETFKDEDAVRVHAIITNGGDSVNTTPDKISLEVQIRAKSTDAVKDASDKVDRAAEAGAMAMGAAVKTETIPGYMPMQNDSLFLRYYVNNINLLDSSARCEELGHRTTSTDMGDLSQIMPAFHPYAPGSRKLHTDQAEVTDSEKAYIVPAKLLAMTALDLMFGNAGPCREIIARKAPFTKKEYLDFLEEIFSTKINNYSAGKVKIS
jgi:amidohydrolase